jgi:hypothetical protein
VPFSGDAMGVKAMGYNVVGGYAGMKGVLSTCTTASCTDCEQTRKSSKDHLFANASKSVKGLTATKPFLSTFFRGE